MLAEPSGAVVNASNGISLDMAGVEELSVVHDTQSCPLRAPFLAPIQGVAELALRLLELARICQLHDESVTRDLRGSSRVKRPSGIAPAGVESGDVGTPERETACCPPSTRSVSASWWGRVVGPGVALAQHLPVGGKHVFLEQADPLQLLLGPAASLPGRWPRSACRGGAVDIYARL